MKIPRCQSFYYKNKNRENKLSHSKNYLTLPLESEANIPPKQKTAKKMKAVFALVFVGTALVAVRSRYGQGQALSIRFKLILSHLLRQTYGISAHGQMAELPAAVSPDNQFPSGHRDCRARFRVTFDNDGLRTSSPSSES